jgi:uncharacterized repeat protein (TIGR01451 family)
VKILRRLMMTKLKKKFGALPLVALAGLLMLGGAAAFAQRQFKMIETGRPEVKVFLSGTVTRENASIPVEKASTIQSGEVLNWTITSENDGNAPAHQYQAVGQIPPGTQFVAGSASADGSATVVYSIDNGKTFNAQPTVAERQADGSVKRVPAPVSMYTQLRYEWADPLAQSGKLTASYKVRVK